MFTTDHLNGCCRRLLYCCLLLNLMTLNSIQAATEHKGDQTMMDMFFGSKAPTKVDGKLWLVIVLFGVLPLLLIVTIVLVTFLVCRRRKSKADEEEGEGDEEEDGEEEGEEAPGSGDEEKADDVDADEDNMQPTQQATSDDYEQVAPAESLFV